MQGGGPMAGRDRVARVLEELAMQMRVTSHEFSTNDFLMTDNNPGVTEPAIATQDSGTPVNAIQALMVESRQLENDLRAMPEEPRVSKAGTVATIAEIEDRVAAIDYQLNDPSVQLTEEEEEIFWRERVRLMKLLVGLRYAQAQRTGY